MKSSQHQRRRVRPRSVTGIDLANTVSVIDGVAASSCKANTPAKQEMLKKRYVGGDVIGLRTPLTVTLHRRSEVFAVA